MDDSLDAMFGGTWLAAAAVVSAADDMLVVTC